MSVAKVQTIDYALGGFGNNLTHDFCATRGAAQEFLGSRNWQSVVEELQKKKYPRFELSTILESSALRYGAPEAVLENIRKLKEPQTFVVITGQQSGLLGGPLLTLYKALTAVRWARQLEFEAGGRARFIPVFWVAADDHDWGEIDHAWLLDSERQLRRMRGEATSESLGASASKIRLKPENSDANPNSLRAQLLSVGWTAERVARWSTFYAHDSVADAFIRTLYKQLGQLGLVVAHSGDLRGLGRKLLLAELTHYPETTHLIETAGETMRRAGYEPGFSTSQNSAGPHFFIETEDGIRASLKWDSAAKRFIEHASAFAARGAVPKHYTHSELENLISSSPERFSAAAALRPIVQQTVFPVATVVLGPGEMSYWAQLKSVHTQFDAVWPRIVPRATATLIDGPSEKILRKLGLQDRVSQIFIGAESIKSSLLFKDDTLAALKMRRQTILAEFNAVSRDVKHVISGLDVMLEKMNRRFVHELDRLERVAGQIVRERAGMGDRRIEALLTWIRPRNQPQERVLNCLEMTERFPELVDELFDVFDPEIRHHFVVTLG